jgi:hypothetical protein
MAADAQRAKPGARKTFLPAVPRAFEKKNAQEVSVPTTPSIASENKGQGGVNGTLEGRSAPDDWASLAGEEQVSTDTSLLSQGETLLP